MQRLQLLSHPCGDLSRMKGNPAISVFRVCNQSVHDYIYSAVPSEMVELFGCLKTAALEGQR